MDAGPLRVILLWHMHQPEYREPVSGTFLAPWCYLHALKDYSDMAAHLEAHPTACAVVNFTPVLLDQIEAYVQRLDGGAGSPIGDELLDALRQPVLGMDSARRRLLLRECLRAHPVHLIERFPTFQHLASLATFALHQELALDYLDDAFVADLLVWYHLAWLGESVRRTDPRVAVLAAKARHFNAHDRGELLGCIADTLSSLIARYRGLAEAGRVELSTSPYAHPILPLLLDFASARQTVPAAPLPRAPAYPGGAERCRSQLDQARAAHLRRFGVDASGCWPSEGALCVDSLRLIGEAGFAWAASSQAVLRRSLGPGRAGSEHLHRPYRLGPGGPVCFFRDDALSDLIGFTYKDWRAEDAVADLLGRLQAIAVEPGAGPGRIVTIALDGENAWEHYPQNAWPFLDGLYAALSSRTDLCLSTPARCLAEADVVPRQLDHLVAGSWVYGDLATWIGDPDKNRAWDMLVEARHACEAVSGLSPQAERQLAVCEGSDWFWWPGEHNPAAQVEAFERLFRVQLAALYRLLGQDPPEYLAHAFTHGADVDDAFAVLRPLRP